MSSPGAVPKRRGSHRGPWIGAGLAATTALVLAILLVSGVVRWPFGHRTATASAPATQTVTTEVYHVTVVGPGTLEAARTLAVTNATAGTIAKLASVGQRVTKGDVLAQLDPTPFQRALRDANLALQKAEAQLASLKATQASTAASLTNQVADAKAQVATQQRAVDRASETLASQQRLQALGGVSASEVQTARDDLDDADTALTNARRALSTLQTSQQLQVTSATQDLKNGELAVQQQQLAVEQAQEDLDSITTVAPFDGVVSDVATEVGAYVPEDGTVLTLIDDRTLDLPAQIDETEISKVKVGQSASVTLDAMPGQTFSGTVTAIAPTGQAVSNIPIFEVTVTLDNQALTLRPGMTAQADIAVRTVDDAVTLPLTALHEAPTGASPNATRAGTTQAAAGQATPTGQASRAEGRVVMVQQPDGSFAARPVELVDSIGYNAVVTGDLKNGDVVLLSSTATATSTGTTAGTTAGTSKSTRSSGPSGISVLGGGPPPMGPGGAP